MKILILYPHDLANINSHGSGKKLLNYLKYFSKNHKLYLAGYDNNISNEIKKELSKYCQLIVEQPVKGIKKKLNPFSLLLFRKLNYLIYSKKLEQKINQIIKIEQPDLVHIEFTSMGQYVFNLASGNYKKILFNDEVVLRKMQTEKYKTSNFIRKLWLSLNIPIIRKYEIELCKQFDQILTITAEEKQFLKNYLPNTNIQVSSIGVKPIQFNSKNIKDNYFNLLFVGNYNHKPNRLAAEYLIDLFPKIQELIPNLKLYLVGPNPPLVKQKNIITPGYVGDVNKYYNIADIFVAPIFFGGGLRVKILEAMAMNKAVITTIIGCEGIIHDQNNIVVATNKNSFIKEILYLYHHPESIKKIGQNAQKIIENKYNQEQIYQKLENNYKKLIS